MSTEERLGGAGPASPGTGTDERTKHLFRVAGLGAVGAFVAWLGQPILVFLVIGAQGDTVPDWSEIESSRYNGLIEVLIFSTIGLGLLFLVLATWRLIRRRTSEPSVAATAGHVMGLIAALSWFLVSADSFRTFTSVGAGIPEVTGDPTLQRVITEGTALDITGSLLLFVLGYTGWVVMVATVGRRAGLFGLPLTLVLVLSVLGWVPMLAVPFSFPWPLMGFMVTILVLGIVFLVRSRR